jgi:hypothetical protein
VSTIHQISHHLWYLGRFKKSTKSIAAFDIILDVSLSLIPGYIYIPIYTHIHPYIPQYILCYILFPFYSSHIFIISPLYLQYISIVSPLYSHVIPIIDYFCCLTPGKPPLPGQSRSRHSAPHVCSDRPRRCSAQCA